MSFVDDTDLRYTQIPSTTNASVTEYISTNANIIIASSVTISGVTHTITSIDVGTGVFQNNTTVTEITIPASIATISNNTFKGASNVATINLLHPGLPTLETYAFDGLPSTCIINFRSVNYTLKEFQDGFMLELSNGPEADKENTDVVGYNHSGYQWSAGLELNADGTVMLVKKLNPHGLTIYSKIGNAWVQQPTIAHGWEVHQYDGLFTPFGMAHVVIDGIGRHIIGTNGTTTRMGWIKSGVMMDSTYKLGATERAWPVALSYYSCHLFLAKGGWMNTVHNRNGFSKNGRGTTAYFETYNNQHNLTIIRSVEEDPWVTKYLHATAGATIQLGSPLKSMECNYDGDILLMCDNSTTWIYKETSVGVWDLFGTFTAEEADTVTSISLSKNFTFVTSSEFYSANQKLRIAIGAGLNDGNGVDSGHVRVYEYDPTKTTDVTDQASPDFGPVGWRRIGQDIDGEAAGDQSGFPVKMNGNGDIIAVKAPFNDDGGNDAGHIRFYKITNNTWLKMGPDFDGNAGSTATINATDGFAYSSDGKTITIGHSVLNGGTVKTYKLQRNTVPQLPEATGDNFEMDSISADASDPTVVGTTVVEKRTFTRKAIKDMLTAFRSSLATGKKLKLKAGTVLPGFEDTISATAEIEVVDATTKTSFTKDEMANKQLYFVMNDNEDITLKSSSDQNVVVRKTGTTTYTVTSPQGSTTHNSGDSFVFDGLTIHFGSLTVNLQTILPVDMVLDAFESSFILTEQASLPDLSYILDVSAEITLTQQMTASDLSAVFYFRTDEDITSELGTDTSNVQYYVDRNKWVGGKNALNPMNGIVDTGYYGSNNTDHLAKDFLRDMAQHLFNTHFAVDIFTNEDAVVSDISGKADVDVASTIYTLMGNVDIATANGNGQDGSGHYFQKDDTANTNLTREILNQLITKSPGRFQDKKTMRLYGDVSGIYGMPFVAGDTLAYKLTVSANPSQNTTVNTGKSALQPRTYKVKYVVS